MKILTVAYDLPPILRAQAIQIGRLLHSLPAEYRLYVVTADDKTSARDGGFYGDIDKRFSGIIRRPFRRSIFDKILTRLVPGLFSSPDIFTHWHKAAYRQIIDRWGRERFDRIVTFSYPFSSSLLGMRLKEHFGARWVAFFSDPWVDNPHFGYRGLSKMINRRLEQKVLEKADNVVFASPEMLESYKKKYPFIAAKSVFLEHSYDGSLYGVSGKDSNGAIVVRHIGSFYKRRTVEPVLAALSKILKDKAAGADRIRFEVIGHMPYNLRAKQAKMIKNMGLDAVVKMMPGVPYLESLRLMKSADLLVLVDAPIDGSVYLPSKLIDYIGSGTPILAVTPSDGASARVIRKAGGWSLDPHDAAGIEKALKEAVSLHADGKLKDLKPSFAAQTEFSITAARDRFIGILEGA